MYNRSWRSRRRWREPHDRVQRRQGLLGEDGHRSADLAREGHRLDPRTPAARDRRPRRHSVERRAVSLHRDDPLLSGTPRLTAVTASPLLRGKYQQLGRLGGGMADVFLARTIGADGFSRDVTEGLQIRRVRRLRWHNPPAHEVIDDRPRISIGRNHAGRDDLERERGSETKASASRIAPSPGNARDHTRSLRSG
jgi:hypothetical protein